MARCPQLQGTPVSRSTRVQGSNGATLHIVALVPDCLRVHDGTAKALGARAQQGQFATSASCEACMAASVLICPARVDMHRFQCVWCFLGSFDRIFVRCRMVVVANHLPLRAIAEPSGGHRFEWDEDSLLAQAKVPTASPAVSLCAARSANAAFWTLPVYSSVDERKCFEASPSSASIYVMLCWVAGGHRSVHGGDFCGLTSCGRTT